MLSIRSIRLICQMEKFTIDSTSAVVDRTIASQYCQISPTDKTTFYLLSIGKLHFIRKKWSKCCRFDRFVRFVKWKSSLSIRQVRSSIGQLHLISDNGDPVQDCRIDRFVRFVKWKSSLSIRQVRSSIGQLHLISDNGDPVQDCRIDRFVRLVEIVISFTIPH